MELKRVSISYKIGLILCVNLILLFGILIQNYFISVAQEADALLINMAGRQRMLSQQMTKAVFLYILTSKPNLEDQEGVSDLNAERAEQLKREFKEEAETSSLWFDKTLNTLISGGRVPIGQGIFSKAVPSGSTPDILAQLNRIKLLWTPFLDSLLGILYAKPDNAEKLSRAQNYIHEKNLLLLSEIEKSVKLFELEANKRASQIRAVQEISVVIGLFVFIGTLLLIKRLVVEPLARMTETANEISLGNLEHEVSAVHNDEIGDLANSFALIIKSQRVKSMVAESVARGNFNVDVVLASEHDALGKAMNIMLARLKDSRNEKESRDFIRNGLLGLSRVMSERKDIASFYQKIITFLFDYLNAQTGAVYLPMEENKFELVAGIPEMDERYYLCGKLLEQVVLDKKSIFLKNSPNDECMTDGNSVTSVFVVPCIYGGVVNGVIEIGLPIVFNEVSMELLKQCASSVAVVINSVEVSRQRNELLVKMEYQSAELKEQKKELQKANKKILNRANILEKQQAEIEQKNEELKITSRFKSEFLTNMSHELRTPLNGLLILANMLAENKEGNLSEEQVESAKVIHSSGMNLMLLINDILDLSKVEAGKLEINIEHVKLSKLRERILREFTHVARKKLVGFVVDFSEKLPRTIQTDGKRLEQIIRNFLSNAFKFTEKGVVKVRMYSPESTVTLPKSMADKQVVAIDVSDTGIGIPENKQELIFEAFKQADDTISRKHGGTGLGLSISKEIARLIGGEIVLRSTDGKGSIFTLYIPQELEKNGGRPYLSGDTLLQKGVKAIIPDTSELAEKFSDLRGRKVLLADDDMRSAYAISKTLDDLGLYVVLAEDIEKVMNCLSKERIDVVIIDLMRPLMNGYMSIERIKGENKEIPIIAIGAKTVPKESENAIASGAECYLSKPVSIEKLLLLLQKLCK